MSKKSEVVKIFESAAREAGKLINKEFGKVMWDHVGMARSRDSLNQALDIIPKLRDEFWNNLHVPGNSDEFNPELEI